MRGIECDARRAPSGRRCRHDEIAALAMDRQHEPEQVRRAVGDSRGHLQRRVARRALAAQLDVERTQSPGPTRHGGTPNGIGRVERLARRAVQHVGCSESE